MLSQMRKTTFEVLVLLVAKGGVTAMLVESAAKSTKRTTYA